MEQLRLRIVELFVAKHVEVKKLQRKAKPGAQIVFAGNMLKRDSVLANIEIFYEPPPKTPELSWLRQPRGYALPTESRVLWPKVPPPYVYADRSSGVIDVAVDGSFNTRVKLFKPEPGVYTIVAWVRNDQSRKAFPATEVCVEAS